MPQEELKRDWRHYNKENLLIELNNYDWSLDYDNVQDNWNQFENQILIYHMVDLASFSCVVSRLSAECALCSACHLATFNLLALVWGLDPFTLTQRPVCHS